MSTRRHTESTGTSPAAKASVPRFSKQGPQIDHRIPPLTRRLTRRVARLRPERRPVVSSQPQITPSHLPQTKSVCLFTFSG
jgi:hypothetical protein